MDDNTWRLMDLLIKGGSGAIALIGAAIALMQYRASQRQARAKLWLEQKSLAFSLSSKKSELFADAARTAATIATSHDPQDVRNAIGNFWRLYWGALVLVEGEAVEAAMVALGEEIKNFPGDLASSAPESRAALQIAALSLAQACRTEVEQISKEIEVQALGGG